MNALADSGPEPTPERGAILQRLREIIAALEFGDDELFERKLDQMVRERESGLFLKLGRITRELHRAVQDMNCDDQLARFARADMPDACSRLDYVMQVSEQAAHRTLDLVDQSRALLTQIEATGNETAQACVQKLRENFSALAQAQEYQDLSGQVIRRVIKLVRNVEGGLLALLQASGSRTPVSVPRIADELAGPAVPGLHDATSQQDADALLAELGF